MPGLLTLKTDLKSLKYGQDQPGGGDSGQPYIKTDINTVDSGFNRLRLTKFDDGFVRGGIVGAINASVVDTLRISKFLIDAPKGPLFIAKQIGLQLSNPRLEVPKNPLNIAQGGLDNVLAVGTNGLLEPTRIYNLGINTIAQVPVNAFGAHFNRHGILPVQDKDSKYEAVVTANNNLPLSTNPSKNNRLVSLAKTFELGDRQINNTQNRQFQQVLNLVNTAANVASAVFGGPQIPPINPNPKQLIIDQYFGGPGSVYGIGTTTIRRSSYTEDGFLLDKAIKSSQTYAGKTRDIATGDTKEVEYIKGLGKGDNAISNYDNSIPVDEQGIKQGVFNYSSPIPSTYQSRTPIGTYAKLQNQILNQQTLLNPAKKTTVPSNSGPIDVNVNQFGIYNTQRGSTGNINKNSSYSDGSQEYIAYKNSYGDVIKIKTSDPNGSWNSTARENRVGSFGKAKVSGSNVELRAADSINLTPIFRKDTNVYWYGDKTPDGNYNIRDLVKFAIQAIDTDEPSISDFMIFRAYLTSFSDNVDAKWTDINYVGRGNPFYIYTGFTRKIQIGFKVAALSAAEMKPMYSKLNYLMSNLMPDYNGNIMRGPLVRMTVGNYLDAQLGKLDSLSYTIPNDSPWEIAIDEPEGGTKQLILPHILEVQMSFTPIGAETQKSNKIEEKGGDTSYLAQNSTGRDRDDIQYYNNFFNAEKIKIK